MIEAAIVFPVLFLFIVGIIQYGFVFHAYISMLNAANAGVREVVIQKNLGSSNACAGQVNSHILSALSPALDVASFGTSNISCTAGAAGSVSTISLQYDLPLFFRFVVPGANSNGTMPLRVSAVLR